MRPSLWRLAPAPVLLQHNALPQDVPQLSLGEITRRQGRDRSVPCGARDACRGRGVAGGRDFLLPCWVDDEGMEFFSLPQMRQLLVFRIFGAMLT